ncbi:hypothetical protein MDA_GLEAN10023492 [Myotis davidii]|uniref:Uncharacterized protein n=1 Tax=Myotis davidii TaxID=225400 RepID=L5LZ55_MYODS|nr:hypothetical protein MDA_GLEAN10023492 [Myotis davidii]
MRTKLEEEEEEEEKEEESHVGAWDREIQLHRPGQERGNSVWILPDNSRCHQKPRAGVPGGGVAMVSSDAARRHQPTSPPVTGTVADAL